MVHGDGRSKEYTVSDWIHEHHPNLTGVGEPAKFQDGTVLDRPGIVHRLDKDTSGVLVVAKNQTSFEFLKKLFQEHKIQKTYYAHVWGTVKEDKGIILRPIGRSKSDFRKWSAERFARGELREAITEYRVLKRFSLNSSMNKTLKIPQQFTFLEIKPKTGRTHQIRVHMKAINHPVVADVLYAPNHPQALGFKRHALHASKISFKGINGEVIEVEALLPEDFQAAAKITD